MHDLASLKMICRGGGTGSYRYGLLASLDHDTLACQCERGVGREKREKEWLPEEFASNMPAYIQDILARREKGHIARRMRGKKREGPGRG